MQTGLFIGSEWEEGHLKGVYNVLTQPIHNEHIVTQGQFLNGV